MNIFKPQAFLVRIILPAALALGLGWSLTPTAAIGAPGANNSEASDAAQASAAGSGDAVAKPTPVKKKTKHKKKKHATKRRGKAKRGKKSAKAGKHTKHAKKLAGKHKKAKKAAAKPPVKRPVAVNPVVPAPAPIAEVTPPVPMGKSLAAKSLDDPATPTDEDNKVLDSNDDDSSGSYMLIFGLFLAVSAGAFFYLKRRNDRAAAIHGFGGDPSATMSGTTAGTGVSGAPMSNMGSALNSGMGTMGNAPLSNFSDSGTNTDAFHSAASVSTTPIDLSTGSKPLARVTGSTGRIAATVAVAPEHNGGNLQATTRDVSGDPCTFERFVEVQVAQTVWAEKGMDIPSNLKRHFNMTMLEWSKINVYWNQKYLADDRLLRQFHSLGSVFRTKYGGSAAS